ncbi:MAG TPA: hypothetical protein VKZ75_09585 [Cyclobacteriaceae bacterium]|nr:hypothetical protein [Cyclobacteriaceae bacterium]
MKLKLIQTGGFAGLTKSCEKEMDLTQNDIEDLVNSLALEGRPDPDGLSHTLIIDDQKKIQFCPDATHGKWKPAIEEMMASLEYERPNR